MSAKKYNEKITSVLSSKIINTIQDACFVLDKNLCFVYANKRAKFYWDRTEQELLGKKIDVLFPEIKNTYPFVQIQQALMQQKSAHFQQISPVIDKWIEAHIYPYAGGVIVHFHDFTRRKKLQEKVEEQSQLLQLAQDAFIVQDKENKITFWNGGAPTMYGWKEKEVLGQVAYKLLKTQFPLPLKEIHSLLKKEGIWKGELIHTKRNGESIIVESTWKILHDRGTFSILEVNHDITERKGLEERKNEFISMASHELKTPITSLKIFTQVLENIFQSANNQKALNFLGKMDNQIDRLTRLVQELLDVSRIESGRLELKKEDFDIKELLDEIVEYIQPTTKKHKITLDGVAKRMVCGDRDRIGQVIINLLTNAIKYSPNGGKIILSVKKNSHNIIVTVQDFGIGISSKYLEKVFSRFYQVTSPTEKTYPGLGMGLYISQQIVQHHVGHIWVESRKGKGSIFFFTIPLSKKVVTTLLQQEEIATYE